MSIAENQLKNLRRKIDSQSGIKSRRQDQDHIVIIDTADILIQDE